jgi:hypothetical protein
MLQKNRYEKLLSDKGIECSIPQEEFNNFMAGLRTHRMDRCEY